MKYMNSVPLVITLFQKNNLPINIEYLRNTDSQSGKMFSDIYGNIKGSSYFVQVAIEKLYFPMKKGRNMLYSINRSRISL